MENKYLLCKDWAIIQYHGKVNGECSLFGEGLGLVKGKGAAAQCGVSEPERGVQ